MIYRLRFLLHFFAAWQYCALSLILFFALRCVLLQFLYAFTFFKFFLFKKKNFLIQRKKKM